LSYARVPCSATISGGDPRPVPEDATRRPAALAPQRRRPLDPAATLTSWSKDVPQDLMLTSTGAIRYSYLRY
jgi:hypothetical protein